LENDTVFFQKEGSIAIITLNRPERLNAITTDLLHGLIRHLQSAKANPDVMSVILTGAGKAFCAGEDLKETARGKSMAQWVEEVDGLQEIQRVILGLGKPLVAAIRGYAVGGGLEFALSCDMRIAAQDAHFGFPETSVGLTVTTAGTKLITHIVGLGKAKELILTGRFVDAEEALKIGLVNAVVPAGDQLNAAMDMCRTINARSPLALKLSRVAIDQGLHAGFEQTLELEAAHLLTCVSSQEQRKFVDQKLKQMKKR